MYRELVVIAMASMMLVDAQSVGAATSRNQAPLDRHRIMECMTKRMSVDRAISYNEAAKVCKDQVMAERGQLTLSTDAEHKSPLP